MGGVTVPFVGMLADRIGIQRMLETMAYLPLLAAALSFPLPKRAHLRSGVHHDVAD
jgi:hypothetical protein